MFSVGKEAHFTSGVMFVSTGLTVCYSFPLSYFVVCGDFSFVPPPHSVVETNYNIILVMIGLLIMCIFVGGSLM